MARFGITASLHELEIIDDQQIQAVFGLEAPGLAPHLLDRHPAGIIDENLGAGQAICRINELTPLRMTIELPRPQGMRIQARLGTEHPKHQLDF